MKKKKYRVVEVTNNVINDKKYTYTALLPDYFKKLLKTKRLRFPNS